MKKMLGWAALILLSSTAWGSARDQIVDRIDRAQSSIDIVVYRMTSPEVTDALLYARQRGVRVRLIVDHEGGNAEPQEDRLRAGGVEIRRFPATLGVSFHDKFALFDRALAATPAYNIPAAAQHDGMFTEEPEVLAQLHEQFRSVWNQTEPLAALPSDLR